MVTGDHLRTAISVSHLCNIMPPGKPVLLVDGAKLDHSSYAAVSAAAAAATTGDAPPAPPPGFHLSVLGADGTVEEISALSSAAARVISGELQCAVTGRGFNR